ncbi:hypothetical protein P8452_22010 [Trifolium repens]|nr:hypothetical protein P8452_22010 [Trifolium repens]
MAPLSRSWRHRASFVVFLSLRLLTAVALLALSVSGVGSGVGVLLCHCNHVFEEKPRDSVAVRKLKIKFKASIPGLIVLQKWICWNCSSFNSFRKCDGVLRWF